VQTVIELMLFLMPVLMFVAVGDVFSACMLPLRIGWSSEPNFHKTHKPLDGHDRCEVTHL
jgi:hypothetical protein